MDGWIVEHWIESNDAISPEEDRHGKANEEKEAKEMKLQIRLDQSSTCFGMQLV